MIMDEFDALAETLRSVIQGRPIIFFINPGNWGDSLIREGAETFLRHYNFQFHTVRAKDIYKNRTTVPKELERMGSKDAVMVYNGCGAFSSHYSMIEKVSELSRQFQTAIMLPATFGISPKDYQWAPDTHFFVRDRFESQNMLPNAQFCHDMAFFLKPNAKPANKKTGYFMRTDTERPSDIQMPLGNVDLSTKGRAHTPIEKFLGRIANYEEVHTNRLHIGIAAALLGRRTYLYTNNYFKIRAIYESSIKPYFDNVEFLTSFSPPPRQRLFWPLHR